MVLVLEAEEYLVQLTLTSWHVIFASILFVIVCLVSKIPFFNFRRLPAYIVIAAIGLVIPDLLYYFAAPHLNAGILSITVSTVPLFTYAIMWGMRFEALLLKRVLGIVLGMVAILLLILPEQGLRSTNANYWILAVVLCAVFYAIENVYIAEGISDEMDVRELLSGSNIVAAIVLIPTSFWMDVDEPVSWIFTSAGLAILAIAIFSTIAYMMFFYTIKASGAVFASQSAYIVTISGVLWGILFFSEVHTVWVWLSILVMMAGLALVTPTSRAAPEAVEQML